MTTDTADLPQDLIDRVRALNPAQRITLSDLLDEEPPPVVPEAERAARREMIARRIGEYQRGEVKTFTVEESLAAMDEAIRAVEEGRR